MNAGIKLSFNNKYYIELIEASTGDIKQEGIFHNIVTNRFGSCLAGTISNKSEAYSRGTYRIPARIYVGSGTTEPTVTDTSLANSLWNNISSIDKFEWVDDYTGRVTASVTFPATTSYVGTISEVGVYGGYYFFTDSSRNGWTDTELFTRALLTDSEGQLIVFNKTEFDILKVTVVIELSIESTLDSFIIYKRNNYIRNLLSGSYSDEEGYDTIHGFINLCRFTNNNILNCYDGATSSPNMDLSVNNSTIGYVDKAARTGYVKYEPVRIGTDNITSERYFKAFVISGIGYWKLPNEDIFPTYTITDINIGIGDGTSNQFLNPLSYFKKDTEKIYKNGVLLARGVDYTITHNGNVNMLPEVCEDIIPIKTISEAVSLSTSLHTPLMNPQTVNNALVPYIKAESTCLSNTAPLYIEYETEISANCLKNTGGWNCTGKNYWGYIVDEGISESTVFYLDYSIDGIEYIQIATITAAASTVEFEEVTAKYWRLRTNYSTTPVFKTGGNSIFIFKKDPYITFTETPAEGDVLTMDVDMDIIMKNSNFVIDIGCTLNFTY